MPCNFNYISLSYVKITIQFDLYDVFWNLFYHPCVISYKVAATRAIQTNSILIFAVAISSKYVEWQQYFISQRINANTNNEHMWNPWFVTTNNYSNHTQNHFSFSPHSLQPNCLCQKDKMNHVSFEMRQTIPLETVVWLNVCSCRISVPLHLWNFKSVNTATTNVLGVVMFSVVLGTALGKLGPAGKPLLDFLIATSEAMMIITHWVIWYRNLGQRKHLSFD